MPISMVPPAAAGGLPTPPTPNPVQAGGQTSQPTASASASTMPSSTFQAAELLPSGAKTAGPLAEIATNALSSAHTKIDALAKQMPNKADSAGSDEVAAAMREMSPKDADISSNAANAGDAGNDKMDALNKSFDHAIFMAMVNQVISGVGDTSRTLIRQS